MANSRKLIVEVVGDASKLQRTLKQTETSTNRFAKKLQSKTGPFASFGGAGGRAGLVGGLAAGAAFAEIKSALSAAADAQQVLGQTKVALEDTGKSWARYGKQITDTVAAQSKLGFDDEELLKTFSTFERATGDVTKALKLNKLSADLARARYIDLADASNIVLKASLGQAGALRRVGIDAKKGADATELLTLLTQKYGGAAEAAAGDAVTANQRLKVSLQNVQEQIGSGLLPVVTKLTDQLTTSVDQATELVKQFQQMKIPGVGTGKQVSGGILNAFKTSLLLTPGLQIALGEQALLKRLGVGAPTKPVVVNLDGQKVTTNVSGHQATSQRNNASQRRGPGGTFR